MSQLTIIDPLFKPMELSIKLYATKSGWSDVYIVTQVIVSNSFSEDRQNVWSDLNANQLTKAHSDGIAERMFLKNLILKKKTTRL